MKKTILVVDDFASIRDFVCTVLEQRGYNTLKASNGKEAFRIIKEDGQSVNLVLTDYNMPDWTGFELLQRIKSDPAFSNIPVIFLTTEADPEKMRNAKKAGLTAWIKKPYRAETFFSQIDKAVANG